MTDESFMENTKRGGSVMGHMRHHAIIVTSWNEEEIIKAHNRAMELFKSAQVTNFSIAMNMHTSFMVGPDGSKEGWPESDIGDTQRAAFLEYLDSIRYDDGSTCLDWVEVQYGDDEKQTLICNDSNAAKRGEERP